MGRSYPVRSRWWLAVVQIVLLLATILAPAAAAATSEPLTGTQLLQILQSYGIVKGDERGNLNLDKPITRAEMITIMVRALGKDSEADLYKSVNVFTDAKGHWAEGYIGYAFARNLVKGDGNGLVRPGDPISWAEALTLILRVVEKEPTSGDWPVNILLAAADYQLIPAGINLSNIRESAVRGVVFNSLAKGITTLTKADGKTYLQSYVDSQPPVISLTKPAETTKDTQIRLSGTIQGANEVVVNGNKVAATNGTFTTDIPLVVGANKIAVTAKDLAGNAASTEVTVTRIHPVATLEIAGPDKVRPGGTAIYLVSGKDPAGNPVSTEGVTAKVEGNIGTFNLAKGEFVAGATPAKGKITVSAGSVTKSIDVEVMGLNPNAARLIIRPINDGRAVSFTRQMTVMVEVQDASGQFLSTDFGRAVSLSVSGLAGATVTPTVAYTEAGVVTFTVRAASMGFVSLSATSGTLYADARVAEFGSNMRVRLTSDPGTVMVGGATTVSRIRALLVDENGSPAANTTNNDIVIQISKSGVEGTIINSFLRIPRNTTSSASSGEEGTFAAGAVSGSATINGTVTSGQSITVDPTSVTITVPSIGSGSFWDIIGSLGLTKNVQNSFMVRLADASGSTIPGAYAYTIGITTSNNEPKVDGIPTGVEVYMGNVRVTNTATVLRTSGGIATMKVVYDKPGHVNLTISPAGSSSSALGSDGTTGVGAGSGIQARAFTFTVGGTVAGVRLRADSDAFGENHDVAATTISTGRPITLRAYLTDNTGNWIPNSSGTVTIARGVDGDGINTTLPNNLSAPVLDGKATFTIYPTATDGTDTYSITASVGGSTLTGNTLPIFVHKTAPAQPAIIALRGINNGVPGALNFLSPEDNGLEIELAQDSAQSAVVVKVFTEGGYSPIYTSAPISLNQAAPRITVPKTSLPSGVTRYQVTVRNGHTESVRSASSSQVTNSVYTTSITLSSARLQRATNTLTINGSNFSNGDTINPALIRIYDSSNPGQDRSLAGATVVSVNYNQIVLNVLNATYLADLKNPALFSGSDVTMRAQAGWYIRTNGEQSREITTGAPVTPMAHVTHAVYDRTNNRLFLSGTGLNGVNINYSKVKLVSATQPTLTLNGYNATRQSDSQWMIPIDNAVITALDGAGGYTLTLEDDWAYEGSWTQPGLSTIPIYAQISLSSVNYVKASGTLTIHGSGFTDGTVTIGSLKLVDLSATPNGTALAGTYTITGDDTITITLSPDVLLNDTNFKGDDVYLTGSAGWFQKAGGRQAANIPDRTLRLPTINP